MPDPELHEVYSFNLLIEQALPLICQRLDIPANLLLLFALPIMEALAAFSEGIGALLKEDLPRRKGIFVNIFLCEMGGEDSGWASSLSEELNGLLALELHALGLVESFGVVPVVRPVGVAEKL